MFRLQGVQLLMFTDEQVLRGNLQRLRSAPKDRYSLKYCLWLDHNNRQRYEIWQVQQYRCNECGRFVRVQDTQLHHRYGYVNLGYEESFDLEALHSRCHRNLHERANEVREWCGVPQKKRPALAGMDVE